MALIWGFQHYRSDSIENRHIILASSSPYRRELLQRLGLPFSCQSPEVDESPQAGESTRELVFRLAEAKARSVADQSADTLVIGSDQAMICDDVTMGKPMNHTRAREQLQSMSGKRVRFSTGLCLVDTRTGTVQTDIIDFDVYFRILTEVEIERYLELEQPYDCAGSFKSERLGISLVEKMQGDDPTALIGLPLIRLCEMLRAVGLNLP